MICPTVRVKSSHPDHVQGFYTINESDFDPKIHELWEEPAAKAERAEVERVEAKRAEAKPAARESQMHLGSRKG